MPVGCLQCQFEHSMAGSGRCNCACHMIMPATVNTPEETFATGRGYMLNTKMSALTSIPIGTERLREIRAKKEKHG